MRRAFVRRSVPPTQGGWSSRRSALEGSRARLIVCSSYCLVKNENLRGFVWGRRCDGSSFNASIAPHVEPTSSLFAGTSSEQASATNRSHEYRLPPAPTTASADRARRANRRNTELPTQSHRLVRVTRRRGKRR